MFGKVNTKWSKPPYSILLKDHIGIFSRDDFVLLIKRERLRADRGGSYFSLALFHYSPEIKSNQLKNMIIRFRKNIREVDFIGWYDQSTIGVLLPETPYEGAIQFSRHIKEAMGDLKLNDEITSYPRQNEPEEEGNETKASEEKSMILVNDFSRAVPVWKSALDKIGSIAGFVVFSPFFILLPLYIKLVSPGPVFYSQTRVGYRGKEFRFWKFRTMHIGRGTDSHSSHLKDLIHSDKPMTKLDEKKDPRIIPGGRIIRKACLDELPQIYNIFKGDMSLVGPRPCIPYEAEEYLQWHKYRFDIKPGLTGLWQVSGKNKLTFKEMIRLDITYSKSMSPLLDLRIIAATIPAIFSMILDALAEKLHPQSHEQIVDRKRA